MGSKPTELLYDTHAVAGLFGRKLARQQAKQDNRTGEHLFPRGNDSSADGAEALPEHSAINSQTKSTEPEVGGLARLPPDDVNWRSVLAAVADENAVAIINIASDHTMTTDQKMRSIYDIDNRALGWDSPKWASMLNVTDAAVRKTDWWKIDRLRLRR